MTDKELERFEAFEFEWHSRLGGPQTLYLRELLAYCAKRLEMAGAARADVILYLAACWEFCDELDDEEKGREGES